MRNSRLECVKPANPGFGSDVERVCFKEVEVNNKKINVIEIYFKKFDDDFLLYTYFLKTLYTSDIAIIYNINRKIENYVVSFLRALGIVVAERGREGVIAREGAEQIFTVRKLLNKNDLDKILINIAKELDKKIIKFVSGKKILYMGNALLFYPLRCYRILMKGGSGDQVLSAEEAEFCLELGTGSLVRFSESNGLRIDTRLGQLGELEDEVVEVLETIGERGEISLEEIAEVVGSSEKAEVIVQVLVDYGLLEPLGLDTYAIARLTPRRSYRLVSLLGERNLLVEGSPKCGITLEPVVPIAKLDKIVSIFGIINNKIILYYPVFLGVFVKKKGDQRSEEIAVFVDGVTGARLNDLEEVVASGRMIYTIDEIIDNIVKNRIKEIICDEQMGNE